MTAQKSSGKRCTSLLATGTAALLVASGLALAPTAAFADATPEGVAVTQVNGADPHKKWPNVAINAGSTLTLTGSLPATLDASGTPTATGAYLMWCLKPADGQRPATANCDSSVQQWLLSAPAMGQPATGAVADGVWNFEAQITPPTSIGGTACSAGAGGTGECGLYVRPDHRFGTAVTEWDQFIPIRFASQLDEAQSITAQAVPSASDPVNKVKIEASGSGIVFESNPLNTDTGAANAGAYFALVEKGAYLSAEKTAVSLGYQYVPPTATGAAATLEEFDLSKLDAKKEYEVVSWRAHGAPSAERFLGAVDFDLEAQLTATQWRILNTGREATVSKVTDKGMSIAVSFTGANGMTIPPGAGKPGASEGVYVSLIEAGTVGELSKDNQGIVADFVTNDRIVAGAGQSVLNVQKADLDRTKSYEIYYWYAHSNPSPETMLGTAPLAVTEAQWNTLFPPAPVVATTKTSLKFSKTTAGYNSARTAYVTVTGGKTAPTGTVTLEVPGKNPAPVKLDKNGKATFKLTTLTKVGTHTATASFKSSSAAFKSSSAKASFKVSKTTPKVSASLSKTKVSTKQNATVKVSVTVPGSLKAKASKLKVTVYDGKKKIKTATTSSTGKVSVKLPKLKKGTHKVKVYVYSSTNLSGKYSSTKTLKVTK